MGDKSQWQGGVLRRSYRLRRRVWVVTIKTLLLINLGSARCEREVTK